MAAAETPPPLQRQIDRDAEQRAEGTNVLPLTEICIQALVRYKRFLGDVGHLWHRIYKNHYGQPDADQLLPLPGQPPPDYAPPAGLDCTPADYRGMLQQREAELAARKAAAAHKLRANYKAESSKRLAHGVEYTTKLPPAKRAKASSPAAQLQKQRATAGASRTLGGKPDCVTVGRSHAIMFNNLRQNMELTQLHQTNWNPLVNTLVIRACCDFQQQCKTCPDSYLRWPPLAASSPLVTLGLYVGIPHILLALLAFSWWRPAAITLALLLLTLLLPAKPLRVNSVLSSYVFLCWRRYFKFSYLFEKSLDCYQDYVIAQFPHGAFPLGALLGGTFMATEYPEYHCYATAASSAFFVPIWRHVHAWLGTEVCTKTNFHRLLSLGVQGPLPHRHHHHSSLGDQQQEQQQEDGTQHSSSSHSDKPTQFALAASVRARFRHQHSLSSTESSDSEADALLPATGAQHAAGCSWQVDAATGQRKTGVSVGLMVGGIAEMFMIRRDHERIKVRDRKGFVRVAVERGVPILPVYMFGANQPPHARQRGHDPRRVGPARAAPPAHLPGDRAPMDVGPPMRKEHPDFAARVDEVHAAFISEIQRVYYMHRAKYGHGFEERPLVIC
ncbi:hypothetical protein COO60DRAFT_1465599 [Scenedesmus sp. NREL 46B-D3]|nr:hypothetical protein COO60DRAFT_1465599 [Scenedesmus sp. NREL 46B-D3]